MCLWLCMCVSVCVFVSQACLFCEHVRAVLWWNEKRLCLCLCILCVCVCVCVCVEACTMKDVRTRRCRACSVWDTVYVFMIVCCVCMCMWVCALGCL